MSQNTEQNMRTRDEQIETLAFEIALWGKSNLHERRAVAEKNLKEAEARGAAEERAKAEKALIDPATVHQNLLRGGIAKPSWEQIKHLYPANVAALEARVKELEGDAARFAWVAENTGCFWYGLPGFGPERGRSYENRMKDLRSAIDRNMARAALTREGGV